MLPVVVIINVATACVPVRCWYQGRLHLWPQLTDACLLIYHRHTFSTSCNSTERNLMESSRVTEWDTPPVRFFQSVFLHINSKIPLPLCRNVEVLRHVDTFILVLQETHPLNTEVIHFPENFCKTVLWAVPRKRAVQWGCCLILHTTHELKIAVENDTVLPVMNFPVPKSVNSLCF
jgi:hypothetical protein